MRSTKHTLLLLGMAFSPDLFNSVVAAQFGHEFMCPVPETVTVTKTVEKVSGGHIARTKPTSVMSTTASPSDSTHTVVKTITDVITLEEATTTSAKKNGGVHVVTVVSTIWVHPGSVVSTTLAGHSSNVPGLATTVSSLLSTTSRVAATSNELTTTERSTRFSTQYVTLNDTASTGSATSYVLSKPLPSVSTKAPYSNGTIKTPSGTGPRFTTLLASTGINTGHHHMTATASASMSISAAAGKGKQTVTVTLPRAPHHKHYIVSPAQENTTQCSGTATDHDSITLKTSVRATAHHHSVNSSAPLPTLVSSSVLSFSLAPLPSNVTPTTVSVAKFGASSANLAKRSEVDMVFATIEGQRVSWLNNYTPLAASIPNDESAYVFPTPVTPIPISAMQSYGHSSLVPSSDASSFPTPVMPIPTSAMQSYGRSSLVPSSDTSSFTNSYGSFTLGPLPPTTTPHSGPSAPTKTANAPAAHCSGTELGNFVIGFDDLPTYGEPANKTIYPPVPIRYHHLFWSEGFSYVPPPSDPFPPHSGHQLGMFIVNDTANVHSENEPTVFVSPSLLLEPDLQNGVIGSGPNFRDSAYWFDVKGVYFGCAFTGETHCHVAAFGWKYNETSGRSEPSSAQHFRLPMCQGNNTCSLLNLKLNKDFQNLTTFQLKALGSASKKPVTYYLDDLELQWSNDTCAANAVRNGDH